MVIYDHTASLTCGGGVGGLGAGAGPAEAPPAPPIPGLPGGESLSFLLDPEPAEIQKSSSTLRSGNAVDLAGVVLKATPTGPPMGSEALNGDSMCDCLSICDRTKLPIAWAKVG